MPKQRLVGTCKLCLQTRELAFSHVIPEWCYERIYDERHRALVVQAEHDRVRTAQKGEREHLLCDTCETHLSRFEGYVKKLWLKLPSAVPVPPKGSINLFTWPESIDYEKFRLFHLSILWRASVAKTLMLFNSVSLGPYEEKLRQYVLAGKAPPPAHFPLYGTLLVDGNGAVQHGLVSTVQCANQIGSHTLYYVVYAGVEWSFLATDKHVSFKGDLTPFQCTPWPDKPLTLIVQDLRESNTAQTFARDRARERRPD